MSTRAAEHGGAEARERLWSYRSLSGRATPWLVLQGALLLVFVAFLALGHRRINHDCAMYVQCGQLILAGRVPYVDLVELNPPLIMYVNVLPALAARLVALPATLTFHLFVGSLVVVSLLELRCLLGRSKAGLDQAELGVLSLAWLGAATVTALGNLGQREHLFVLLYFPFAVLRWVRYEGARPPRWLAIVIGVQAAVGVCLKPHFLVIAAVVEVAFLASYRVVRPLRASECVAFVAAVAAYPLHWLVVPGAMRQSFFGRWLPLVLSSYGAYAKPLDYILADVRRGSNALCLSAVAMCLAAWLALRARVAFSRLLLGLAACSAASLALYVQQRKGWGYHLVPFYAAGAWTLGVLAVQLRRLVPEGEGLRRLRRDLVVGPFLAGVAAVALGVGLLASRGFWFPGPEPTWPVGHAVERHTEVGDKVLVISTSVTGAYPLLVLRGRLPGSRYLWCFPIAFFYPASAGGGAASVPRYRSLAEASAAERQFLADLAADIRAWRPRLIAVPNHDGAEACCAGFNVSRYLEHVGLIRDVVADRYKELTLDAGWKLYVLRP